MRIAITGMGIVSAIGVGTAKTLRSLQQERSGIRPVSILPTTHHELPMGEVKMSNAELKQLLGIGQSETISRTALLGIAAAKEALTEAGADNLSEMAFINGTTVGGMDLTEERWKQQPEDFSFVQFHSAGSSTKQIEQHLGRFAYTTTISTACSSALNAIITGCNLLRTGRYKRVLVGGSECLTLFHLNGFRSLMITDSEPCRPFCRTRNGLNLGEGAAYLVLEAQSAEASKDCIAYIGGYGNACDAHHQTASSAEGEGAYLAMKQAIQMAGLKPKDIDYINAHGTATENNDASETTAMLRLFDGHLPAFSSTKAFTGHTTSASGSIETVLCLLAMQHNFLPANLNWREQMQNGLTPVLHNRNACLQNILCNSFGFGGNDSSMLLQRNPQKDFAEQNDNITIVQTAEVIESALSCDYKQYIPPLEARRLTPALRATLVAAHKAIKQSGITPDAILTATDWGCIHNSVLLLNQLTDEGEDSLRPTLFMQSTHNTMSSLVAIRTRNHGYNSTYSHGNRSWEDALIDAQTQIRLGTIGSALVIGFEEEDPEWLNLTLKAGISYSGLAKAVMITKK